MLSDGSDDTYREYYLRNWTFSGSIDGNSFHVLRKHINDNSLNRNNKKCIFKINNNNDKYYNIFKISMDNVNSYDSIFKKHQWVLSCSSFDIYGKLNGTFIPNLY